MNNINKIFGFELKMLLRQKSLIITTTLMFIMMFAAAFVPSLIANNSFSNPFTLSDKPYGILFDENYWDEGALEEAYPEFQRYEKEDALREAVKEEKVDLGLILKGDGSVVLIRQNRNISDSNDNLLAPLLQYRQQKEITKGGMDSAKVQSILREELSVEEEILGQDTRLMYLPLYVMIFAFYFLLLLFGNLSSMVVAREKSDRTMELLVSSAKASHLITGKVLAAGLAGILCIAVTGLGAVVGTILSQVLFSSEVMPFAGNTLSPMVVFIFLAFYIPGHLLYLYLFATAGASVSRIEEVNNAAGPIVMIIVVSFLVAMFGLNNPGNILLSITSFIPFCAPFTMFIRYAMTSMPLWQVGISWLILIFSTFLIALYCTKKYRSATLHYGGKVKKRWWKRNKI